MDPFGTLVQMGATLLRFRATTKPSPRNFQQGTSIASMVGMSEAVCLPGKASPPIRYLIRDTLGNTGLKVLQTESETALATQALQRARLAVAQ